MELEGLTGQFYRVSLVISRMAYINILWIIFTLLGLIVFGFMPATVGLFAVIRKWLMGEKDIPIFSTFWMNYRREFLKSNLLGLILFVIGYILYIDFTFLPAGGFYTFIRVGLVMVTILYAIILLYIFPVYVHYEWKLRLYLKYALLLGAGHPHFTFLMIIGGGALYYVCTLIPGIIPFFSVSILAYIMMWTAYVVIKKMEDMQVASEEVAEEEAGEENDI